jgi:hypothetical protein
MDNIKEIGNIYENHICQVISEMLGIKFKPTQRSGGGFHAGDIRDWTQGTPLKRYCIELKYHKTQKQFNKELRNDLIQAKTQTPTNKNWMLITALPDSDVDLVVMDLKDYICNELITQMMMRRDLLLKLLACCDDALQDLRGNFETFREHLKKEY